MRLRQHILCLYSNNFVSDLQERTAAAKAENKKQREICEVKREELQKMLSKIQQVRQQHHELKLENDKMNNSNEKFACKKYLSFPIFKICLSYIYY